MSVLAIIALALGVVLAAIHLSWLAAPDRVSKWFSGFPRNRWAGWALTAIDLYWSAYLLFQMPMGSLDKYKFLIYGLAPVVFLLVVFLVDELLAARALGGLFLLVPAPMLDAARWHESNWRLVVVVLAYILAVKGMVLVLSPYMFRKTVERLTRRKGVSRVLHAAGLALGALLIALSVAVY